MVSDVLLQSNVRLQNDTNEVPQKHITLLIFLCLLEKFLSDISFKLGHPNHVASNDFIEGSLELIFVELH